MSDYERDVFYGVQTLSLNDKIDIINYSKDKSYEWWVDKLDCSESWARQRIDMSFEEVMLKFSNSCHFTIIHRKGYKNDSDLWRWKVEVGFSTMGGGVDYFLWIHMEETELSKLIEKFKLKELK